MSAHPQRGQWPAGAGPKTGKPLHSPTGKARTAAEARRPIQTNKPKTDGKGGKR
ncbi:hypothetical protein [Sphaerisporangium album]|uniref:hypothetical protein n=1 Tax=Sphaerisporangium album TaxID=509200 RepID=UPI0015F099F3|nr:hypothetical protein [Sphaerisporangium album]